MAVKMISMPALATIKGQDKIVATIQVDAKSEVTPGMSVGDYELDIGSVAYTPALDVAVLGTSGWTWN
jgi:hypothetical protein